MRASREFALDLLRPYEKVTMKLVKRVFAAKDAGLKKTDPAWEFDAWFVDQKLESIVLKRVHDCVLTILPSAERGIKYGQASC